MIWSFKSGIQAGENMSVGNPVVARKFDLAPQEPLATVQIDDSGFKRGLFGHIVGIEYFDRTNGRKQADDNHDADNFNQRKPVDTFGNLSMQQ